MRRRCLKRGAPLDAGPGGGRERRLPRLGAGRALRRRDGRGGQYRRPPRRRPRGTDGAWLSGAGRRPAMVSERRGVEPRLQPGRVRLRPGRDQPARDGPAERSSRLGPHLSRRLDGCRPRAGRGAGGWRGSGRAAPSAQAPAAGRKLVRRLCSSSLYDEKAQLMRYLPLAYSDRQEMLRAVGASSIDDLFVDVPQAARLSAKIEGLADHASELSVERQLTALARKNMVAGEVPFFLGAGAYRPHIPASVDHLIQRGVFRTEEHTSDLQSTMRLSTTA